MTTTWCWKQCHVVVIEYIAYAHLALVHAVGFVFALSGILSTFDQNEIVRKTCKLTVRLSHYFKIRLYAVVTF